MIKISVTKERILIEGHANYADPGHDIVCAAISTLVLTLERSIRSLTKDRPDITMYDGYTELKIGHLSEESNLLIDAFFIGVSGIADEYPEYVSII